MAPSRSYTVYFEVRAFENETTFASKHSSLQRFSLLDFRADYLKIVEGILRYIILEEEAIEVIVNLRGTPACFTKHSLTNERET